MSEISGGSPSSPVPPASSQGTGPERVSKAGPRKEGAGGGEQRQNQGHAATQEGAQARFDPAVSVAPALGHIEPGAHLAGHIVRIDGEGHPLLDTRLGIFALNPDAGLRPGAAVKILITAVDREIRGDIVARDYAPLPAPITVVLTLTALHENPDTAAEVAAPAPNAPPTYRPDATAVPLPAGGAEAEARAAALGTSATTTGAPTEPAPDSGTANQPKPAASLTGGLVSVIAASDEQAAEVRPAQLSGKAIRAKISGTDPLPPGSHLAARFAIATPGPDTDPRLLALAPGSPVTLTALAHGAEEAHLVHEPVVHGVITTLEAITEQDQTPRPSPRPDGQPHLYFQTRIGAFVFTDEAVGRLGADALVGKPLTVAVTIPKVGTSSVAPARGAPAAVDVPGTPGAPEAALTANAAPETLPPLISYMQSWPLIDDVLQAAQQLDPAAQGAVEARLPAPGARLPNTFLFFLAALGLRDPAKWLGEKAARQLEAPRDGALLKLLKGEFQRLSRLSQEISGSEWRPFMLPLHTDSGAQAVVILTRPHHDDERRHDRETEDVPEKMSEVQRFLLEIRLSTLGPVQLDGLTHPGRLDLVIRSGARMTDDTRQGLREIFERAVAAGGLEGSLRFEPMERSPVDVLRVLSKAVPEAHGTHLSA